MRTSTLVRSLGHPPEAVSAFLSDLRNDLKWRPEILRVDLISGTPGQAGAQYKEWVTWEGLHAEAHLTTPEVVPGSRLVVFAKDPGYESTYEYAFAEAEGGCELTLTMSLETTGPLRLIEPFMWSLVSRWVTGSLDALDAVLDDELARPTQDRQSPQTASP